MVAASALRDIVVGRTLNVQRDAFLDNPLGLSFQLFSNGVVGVVGSVGHFNDIIISSKCPNPIKLYMSSQNQHSLTTSRNLRPFSLKNEGKKIKKTGKKTLSESNEEKI